jgi:hypothetical protein
MLRCSLIAWPVVLHRRYLGISLAVVVTSVISSPIASGLALVFLFSAIPVYYLFFYEPSVAFWSAMYARLTARWKGQPQASIIESDASGIEIELHQAPTAMAQ